MRPRRRELATTPVDALNEQLDAWVADTAGLREHGTTRRQPRIAFETSERAALRPLPGCAT